MSYRYMRILVIFDLPTTTKEDMKNYRKFRQYLLKSGYFMLQESVYCKLALNQSIADTIIKGLRKNKPAAGLVQVLTITEKQYGNMIYLTGEANYNKLDSDKRIIVI